MATRDQIATAAQIIRQTVSARQYADLIGLPVDKSGFAQCPFHSGDHTASLKVYGGTRGWHCFGCGAGGDVIELAKRLYSLRYPQAVAKIAQDAGLHLPGIGTDEITYDQAKALAKADAARKALSARDALKERIEAAYWQAYDRWDAACKDVEILAVEEEKHPTESFSPPFCKALMEREEARRDLDCIMVWRDTI